MVSQVDDGKYHFLHHHFLHSLLLLLLLLKMLWRC